LDEDITWYDARDECLEAGGLLASVPSAEESTFLSDLIPDYVALLWVGVSSRACEEAAYCWTRDASPTADYLPWGDGQGVLQPGACVSLKKSQVFYSSPCMSPREGYICESPLVAVRPPPSSSLEIDMNDTVDDLVQSSTDSPSKTGREDSLKTSGIIHSFLNWWGTNDDDDEDPSETDDVEDIGETDDEEDNAETDGVEDIVETDGVEDIVEIDGVEDIVETDDEEDNGITDGADPDEIDSIVSTTPATDATAIAQENTKITSAILELDTATTLNIELLYTATDPASPNDVTTDDSSSQESTTHSLSTTATTTDAIALTSTESGVPTEATTTVPVSEATTTTGLVSSGTTASTVVPETTTVIPADTTTVMTSTSQSITASSDVNNPVKTSPVTTKSPTPVEVRSTHAPPGTDKNTYHTDTAGTQKNEIEIHLSDIQVPRPRINSIGHPDYEDELHDVMTEEEYDEAEEVITLIENNLQGVPLPVTWILIGCLSGLLVMSILIGLYAHRRCRRVPFGVGHISGYDPVSTKNVDFQNVLYKDTAADKIP